VNASPVALSPTLPNLAVVPRTHLHVEVLRRPRDSAQYLSIRYSDRLAANEIVASVGSKGDSYDCEDPRAVVEPSLAGSPTSLLRVA
jgi:hypothetical protein